MRIAYCEDEQAQAELVKEYMDSWAKKRNISCTVELFPTAEEFLFALDEWSEGANNQSAPLRSTS